MMARPRPQIETNSEALVITQLLDQHLQGDGQAMDALLPLIYQRLLRMARAQRSRTGLPQSVLNTTMLVHEAWLKLFGDHDAARSYHDRSHFYAICSRVMRQVVIDFHRRASSERRGGQAVHVELSDDALKAHEDPIDVALVVEALDELAKLDERMVSVFEMAHFVGMETAEIAQTTGLGVRCVQRDLQRAKAWLSYLLQAEQIR